MTNTKRIQPQTTEQRLAMKQEIASRESFPQEVINQILNLNNETTLVEKESGKSFNLVELQLQGCLIEKGLRRRYVGYTDLKNYEVK
jgi:hypothetical protein